MIDPSYDLQKAVYQALSNASVAGGRIYHRVPKDAALPLLHIGDDVILSDFEGGGDFYDCSVVIDVFGDSKPQVKEVVSAMSAVLSKPLTMANFTCHTGRVESVQYLPDQAPDFNAHAVVTYEYKVQPR